MKVKEKELKVEMKRNNELSYVQALKQGVPYKHQLDSVFQGRHRLMHSAEADYRASRFKVSPD